MSEKPTPLLTVHEVCDWTRKTPGAIYTERSRGQGLGALGFRSGKKLVWRREDIETWISSKVDEQRRSVAL